MSAQIIPDWTSDDTFNSVGLGPAYLPGTWTIEGLEVGIDVDTKKAKGADGPTSTDNGLEAAKFKLVGQLTERDWPLFQAIVPDINPRRPGRDRAPVEILHQLTEMLGIRHVRELSIKLDPPTARDGIKVAIEVVEWFPAPKPAKVKKSARDEKPIQGPPAPAGQLMQSVESFIEVNDLVVDDNGKPVTEWDPVAGKRVPVYTTRRIPDPNGPQRVSVLDYDAYRREKGAPLPDTTSQDAILGNLFAAGNPGGGTP